MNEHNWSEWLENPGYQPVADGVPVKVKFLGGDISLKPYPANYFCWDLEEEIISYRYDKNHFDAPMDKAERERLGLDAPSELDKNANQIQKEGGYGDYDNPLIKATNDSQVEQDAITLASPKSKYHREIAPGVWVDVYDVLKAWKVENPALQHLIKKALQPGARGHKDLEQGMDDIVASAIRARELEE